MGDLWNGKALEEAKEMKSMRNNWDAKYFLAALCFVAVLATASTAAGQSPQANASADKSYCVGMGYLYRTDLGINNGQGFCQFDGTWCDAHAFATGKCGASTSGFFNPYGNYYPYYNPYYLYGPNYGGSIASCSSYGGRMETIHTPYGDFDRCVLPNGGTVDLYGLSESEAWYREAYSFLNSP
jgi:putative hemolysin